MKFYSVFLFLPFLIALLAEEQLEETVLKLSEEDRKFLEELPARQAGLLARLIYIFRRVARKDREIQAALAEVLKPEYYTARAKLYNLPSFREIRTRLMSYDTLYKLTYFYDPVLFVFDLAKSWNAVTPSFLPLFENPKFMAVADELVELVERANEILKSSLKEDMAVDVLDALTFIMSQEFANAVVTFSKLDLDLTREFQLMTKDYGLKKLIDRLGIKY